MVTPLAPFGEACVCLPAQLSTMRCGSLDGEWIPNRMGVSAFSSRESMALNRPVQRIGNGIVGLEVGGVWDW